MDTKDKARGADISLALETTTPREKVSHDTKLSIAAPPSGES